MENPKMSSLWQFAREIVTTTASVQQDWVASTEALEIPYRPVALVNPMTPMVRPIIAFPRQS